MLSWHGCGVSVMEMSHRGREFMSICEQAESDLRELLSVPPEFRILFMQGGGLGQNAIVPMNLIGRSSSRTADFVLTGSWSIKSQAEARRYGEAHIAASSATGRPTQLPDPSTWHISKDPAYLHLCSNETIDGIEFQELPDLRALGCTAPLVIDCSSASDTIDRYVVYNYAEDVWYYGTMARTAWLDTALRNYPFAASYSNNLVTHENGLNDNVTGEATAIEAYVLSSEFDIADGHNFGFVYRMLPDMTFNGSTATAPTATMYLYGLKNSGSGYTNPIHPRPTTTWATCCA